VASPVVASVLFLRLSVDLDYNYFGHLDRAAMLEAKPAVEQAVAEIARPPGPGSL